MGQLLPYASNEISDDDVATDEENINEIQSAYILMSLSAVADSWENDELDLEDMCEHLEAVNEVVSGEMDYIDFIKETGLKDIRGLLN